jgi:hypothetical protein
MKKRYLLVWRVLLLVSLLGVIPAEASVSAESATPAASVAQDQSPVLGWQTETVDNSGAVGPHTSLALDAAGYPHISYYDIGNATLRYAYYDGAAWSTTLVDNSAVVGTYSSLALNALGQPCISYYDLTNTALKYAYFDGGSWHIETVTNNGSVGMGTSLALDAAGRPHISFFDNTHKSLGYAHWDGAQWAIESANSPEQGGEFPSLVLDAAGHPHISYDRMNSYLRYTYYDGATWHASIANVGGGQSTSLALDAAGHPHISYFEDSAAYQDLEYAYHDGVEWSVQVVDSAGIVGWDTSLALDNAGRPRISYYDVSNGDLKFAYYDGSNWHLETIDSPDDVGQYTSLALDATGQPHISYYDVTNTALKYASDVDLDFHRLAAQLIEEVRGTDMAPGWETAHLGSDVRPLYRPDVEGVAYYEFPVEVASQGGAGLDQEAPAGFIIVSTGEHDFPIPHWNFAGDPPTRQLETLAQRNRQQAARYYKLDTLAYAAEDSQGSLVASTPTLPAKTSGLDPAWFGEDVEPRQVSWRPDPIPDDTNADQISATLVISGPEPPPSLQIEGWNSWDELKMGYGDAYGALVEQLRQDASEEWEVISGTQRSGRILFKGDVYPLATLWPDPDITLSGAGTGYVQTNLIPRPGLPSLFQITVVDDAPGEQLPLSVQVQYTNGISETILFSIDHFYLVYLPLVNRGAVGQTAAGATTAPAGIETYWGEWHYYQAGTTADQRWYDQIAAGDPPNTSTCTSGCGSTGWAMLFGWADNQAAEGNPDWVGRWGLYRVDGGRGPNDVAPNLMTEGVKNMIWEIRNETNTWCWYGAGATDPWDMESARGYLSGRTAARLDTGYCPFGCTLDSLRNCAKDSIINRGTPAVIGTGLLAHFPLAYRYRYRNEYWNSGHRRVGHTQHEFYVNQGWGGSGVAVHGWVPGATWFCGELFP